MLPRRGSLALLSIGLLFPMLRLPAARAQTLEVQHGSSDQGGIQRAGAPGSYTYAVKPGFADKPVNYVSFYDALCFTNWLSNGQGSADTDTGTSVTRSMSSPPWDFASRAWSPSPATRPSAR